jgi:hypothetical protein
VVDLVITGVRVFNSTFPKSLSQCSIRLFVVVYHHLITPDYEGQPGQANQFLKCHNSFLDNKILSMGNSTNFELIRTKARQEREEKIQKYYPIFTDIVRKSGFSPSRI